MNVENLPYTYLIGWSKLDIWYYGCRYAKDCHPDDFWVKYFTSSQYVAEFIRINGQPDIREVRQIFTDNNYKTRVTRCQKWEEKFLEKVDAIKSDRWLNKSNKGSKFNTAGMAPRMNANGQIIMVSLNDPKIELEGLVGVTKGQLTVKHTVTGETKKMAVNDPAYTSGEWVHISTGTMAVKDASGKTFSAHINDPLVLSGEWVPISKGVNKEKVTVKDITTGETKQVDITDLDYINGKLVAINKGKIPVVDPVTGLTKQVDRNDPDYISGKLVSTNLGKGKGLIPVKNLETGERLKVYKDHPDYLSGKLVPFAKGITRNHKKWTCPHCGTYGGGGSMTLNHGDNCKMNPANIKNN